jgi:hypothetical protein
MRRFKEDQLRQGARARAAPDCRFLMLLETLDFTAV